MSPVLVAILRLVFGWVFLAILLVLGVVLILIGGITWILTGQQRTVTLNFDRWQ